MPPKKDKGKKGKKEKKEKEEKEPTVEVVDENTRQFFLLQIKDLEEKLKRYSFNDYIRLGNLGFKLDKKKFDSS